MKSFCLAAFLAAAVSADDHSVNRVIRQESGVPSVIPSPTLAGVNFAATYWYKSLFNEQNEEYLTLGGQYQMSLQDGDVFGPGDQVEFAVCLGACTDIDIFSYEQDRNGNVVLGKKISDEPTVADIMPTLGNTKPSSVFTGSIISYQTKTWTAGDDVPVYEDFKAEGSELMDEGASIAPNGWENWGSQIAPVTDAPSIAFNKTGGSVPGYADIWIGRNMQAGATTGLGAYEAITVKLTDAAAFESAKNDKHMDDDDMMDMHHADHKDDHDHGMMMQDHVMDKHAKMMGGKHHKDDDMMDWMHDMMMMDGSTTLVASAATLAAVLAF